MTNQLLLALIVVFAIATYVAVVVFMPKKYKGGGSHHLKSAMQRLEDQNKLGASTQDVSDASLQKKLQNSFLVRAYLSLPFVSSELEMIERAGLLQHFDRVIMAGLGLMVALFLLTYSFGILSLVITPILALGLMYLFVSMCAKKRRRQFLDLFPDALDIIVRSVKAGYPINNSIAMVADSMPAEIGKEYTRIVNEAAYGYTLAEAVDRFAVRIDQPDVSFFSVVISVQQETGGNLSEILSNLSSVIRQRRHLRLKVRALSAEGRMTVVVLIGIAFFMVGLVYIFSPAHFKPLLETSTGHTVMTTIGCIFIATFFIIRRIINFKI